MNDENEAFDLPQQSQLPISGWWLIAVAAIFAAAGIWAPDLAWVFLIGFAIFVWFVLTVSGREESAQTLTLASKQALKERVKVTRHSVAEAMQYPVYIIDREGRIECANKFSQNIFGLAKFGERISIRFREPNLRGAIEKTLKTGKVTTVEYNEEFPDNRWFNVEISPIFREGKSRPSRFVVVFHELTESKRIDRMRSDFIANASHELRTPLASLLGYLETLKGPAKNDKKAQLKFYDTMQDQAERMSRLVNDLLSLSHIEMKSHVRPSSSVNITEAVKRVVDSLRPLANKMGVEIELDAPKNLTVRGEDDELVQVFENLIENACKYGQDGELIKVSVLTSEDNQNAEIKVRDFGPGIAEEHQRRITERFYRVDVARSREKQGTGLGLAIVKHILQRHGTRLHIASEPGNGAEFSVKLPLVEIEED